LALCGGYPEIVSGTVVSNTNYTNYVCSLALNMASMNGVILFYKY